MSKRRSISAKERARLFLLHGGTCHICGGKIHGATERWEISHEIPLELGGADDDENRKLAHYKCHRTQTAQVDIPRIAKAKRTHVKHIGAKRSSRPMVGSRRSPWKRKLDGTVVRRDQE